MVCHSERSEESTSGHAAEKRCENSIGFFAALRMTGKIDFEDTA
jgi:hypothetical protein